MFHKFLSRSIFALLLIFFILPISAQERPTPTPPDTEALTTEQMRSAIVVSDMRATNRVMATPNQDVVYRLADCDETVKNAPCYVVVSAEILEESSFSKIFTTKPFNQSVNRHLTLQCTRGIYADSNGGIMAELVQRAGVIFHTNSNSAPVTLQWGDTAGTWAGALFKWLSFTGPTPNPGWGTRTNSNASVNTNALGEIGTYYVIGWIGVRQISVGIGVSISSSGWGCF